MSRQRIVVLTTGGTIDKSFDPVTGTLTGFDDKVKACIQSLRLPWLSLEISSVVRKDSLEVTQNDRNILLGAVRMRLARPCPIVITHGTDTVVETGRFLDHAIPDLSTPIVLTGAMIPLGFDGSDGSQNLAECLMAAQLLPAGVFLVIHGEAYPIQCVEKLAALATFGWSCAHAWHRRPADNAAATDVAGLMLRSQ